MLELFRLTTNLESSGGVRNLILWTLAFLYASKWMSSKAFSIWRVLARNLSGCWTDPAGENDLQDATTNIISGKDTAAVEASRILEELSDQDLVLQHLGWIADIDQLLAVQVLTSKKRTHQLSPDAVLAAIDPKKVEILQRYLQCLIEDQDYEDTQFHTSYALLLAKSAIKTFEIESTFQNSGGGTLEETNISDSGVQLILHDHVVQSLP